MSEPPMSWPGVVMAFAAILVPYVSIRYYGANPGSIPARRFPHSKP